VVVHAPEHVRSLADLSDESLALVAEAWRLRAEGPGYVHAFVNEGRVAGSSLPHTHSQLVWLSEPPPAVVEEGAMSAVLDGELVLERDGVAVICPGGSTEPYEMRIAPTEPEARAFTSDRLAPAIQAAAESLRRLRTLEPGAPANLWLHDGPWWHLHLVPRLTVAAGIELGAGIHVNPLAPEEAAARLRG
jgi:UDPglucose--hexose-1-phosphate uridylyltransferase